MVQNWIDDDMKQILDQDFSREEVQFAAKNLKPNATLCWMRC